MTKHTILLCTGFWISAIAFTQPSFPANGVVYNDTEIPKVYVSIHPDSLEYLYENAGEEIEFRSDIIFVSTGVSDTMEETAFRIRGNTSVWSPKKSFEISFNSFRPGRKFHGIEKLHLNGEHNDPSVIRAKLCWDLLRDFNVPAPRSNHVEVFINGNYYGLYINVEHVDEEFVKSRFGNNNGNLYKCLYPADLKYKGQDPELYKEEQNGRRIYDLKTNKSLDDYSDLAHFIDVLNNTPSNQLYCELNEVFNVADYLKIMVIDILTSNWDGYIFNKNNFYLYHNTETGKFEYIPYDVDNTFGIDWFGIDWGTRDIYNWGEDNRPLYSRLIEDPVIKDQASFYFSQCLNEIFATNVFFPRIELLKQMISPSVQNDPFYPLNYGYSFNDFLNSYEAPLWGHVTYGLKPYISQRITSAMSQLQLDDMSPVVKYMNHNYPGPGNPLWISVYIEDDQSASGSVIFKVNQGSTQSVVLFDDGLHHDVEAGDGFFGNELGNFPAGTQIDYRVDAVDNNGHHTFYPCGMYTIEIDQSEDPELFINEFMASNDSIIADEEGEFDDWIEIYNAGNESVWLGDKYLSDDISQPGKWQFPDMTIPAGGFLMIWADEDQNQGDLHTNFKLSADGETISIHDNPSTGYYLIDGIDFGAQASNISYGRETDGSLVWQDFVNPTPGFSNTSYGIDEPGLPVAVFYPNPVSGDRILFDRNTDVQIFDVNGRQLLSADNCTMISIANLGPGFYLISVNGLYSKFIRQ